MIYQLRIRKLARKDIQEIVNYYEETISTTITDKFLDYLYAEFDFLKKNPNLFEVKYKNSRVRYLKTFPFGIHYRILNNSIVEILAVLHTSRNPKTWINR